MQKDVVAYITLSQFTLTVKNIIHKCLLVCCVSLCFRVHVHQCNEFVLLAEVFINVYQSVRPCANGRQSALHPALRLGRTSHRSSVYSYASYLHGGPGRWKPVKSLSQEIMCMRCWCWIEVPQGCMWGPTIHRLQKPKSLLSTLKMKGCEWESREKLVNKTTAAVKEQEMKKILLNSVLIFLNKWSA